MVARLGVVLSVVVALGAARAASAEVTVYQSDRATVGVGAMVQVLGLGQDVADPVRNDVRAYLFMKEARFRLTGDVLDIRYRLELGMGPEDALATTSGIGLGLLDLNADVPLFGSKSTYVRVGQMKVPYGREQLEYSGAMPFGSRSITNLGFKVGRDVGAGLFTQPGKFLGIIGVWTGGGRDVPPDHHDGGAVAG